MSNMVEEDGNIEKYFTQIRIDELPKGRKPKFQIGNLVRIVFRSDDGPASYQIKDNLGLVCEILYYECTNYDWQQMDERDPFYIIEYKLLPPGRDKEYRYVSEQNLRKVEDV